MFKIKFTEEQKKRIAKRKQEEEKRTIGKVIAIDSKGNEFEKTVMFNETWDILSFGWPIEYYLNDLIKNFIKKRKAIKFIIDIGGRNHKGYPDVHIPINDAREIINKAIKKRREHLNNKIKEIFE